MVTEESNEEKIARTKAQRAKRNKIYRINNSVHLSEVRAKYKKNNPEAHKRYQKDYRKRNKEKIKLHNKKYRDANIEIIRLKRKLAKNPDFVIILPNEFEKETRAQKAARREEERDLEEIRTQTLKNPFEAYGKPKRQLRGV